MPAPAPWATTRRQRASAGSSRSALTRTPSETSIRVWVTGVEVNGDSALYLRGHDMAVYARLARGGRIVFQTGDHPPPHFHAEFGGDVAVFAIRTGELLRGRLAPQDERVVRDWYHVAPEAAVERLLEVWYDFSSP